MLPFEHMLIGSGIQIMKYYLDISKEEQDARLRDRKIDPLKQWKRSPIDAVAIKHWKHYTNAATGCWLRPQARNRLGSWSPPTTSKRRGSM